MKDKHENSTIRERERAYQEKFARFSDRIERKLRICLIVFFVLLLAMQTALRYPQLRIWLSIVDRLEGIPLFVV